MNRPPTPQETANMTTSITFDRAAEIIGRLDSASAELAEAA